MDTDDNNKYILQVRVTEPMHLDYIQLKPSRNLELSSSIRMMSQVAYVDLDYTYLHIFRSWRYGTKFYFYIGPK